jgi:hypothetical protein
MYFTEKTAKMLKTIGETNNFNEIAHEHWGMGELVPVENENGTIKMFACKAVPRDRSGSRLVGTTHEYPRLDILFTPNHTNNGDIDVEVCSIRFDSANAENGGNGNRLLHGTFHADNAGDMLFLAMKVNEFVHHNLYMMAVASDLDFKLDFN